MYLKRFETQGFKSFADKIEIDFNQGITSIVGPNGSGKSNISDAIRWVMGEQSVKSLRGSKMEDIIFAGTEQRKAVGFAEVSLTLDNSERLLPVDFGEVTITRRVFRSGECEYYINKTACRLKDIHEILMDTGLGRDGYSIISQGKIAEILSTRSEDRRQVFEEAAGISKYRYRKEDAERKLADTKDNLTRIEDIISELECRLAPLSDQSDKAKQFLALRDELRMLDVSTSMQNLEKLKATQAETDSRATVIYAQADEINQEAERLNSEIETLYEQSRQNDSQAEDLRQKERETQNTQSQYLKDIEVFKSKLEHGKEGIERVKREISDLHLKKAEILEQIESETANGALFESSKSELDTRLTEVEHDLERLELASRQDLGRLDDLQKSLDEMTSILSDINGKIESNRTLRENLEARQREIETALHAKNELWEEKSAQFAELDSKIQDNVGKINEFKSKYEESLLKLAHIKDKEHKSFDELRALQSKLDAKASRLKALRDMERDFDGYGKSVKNIMQSHEIKVCGTVAQLIKVSPEYTSAIEVALGGATQNIVTETEYDAKCAIEYLKRKNLGRATFLPISAVRGTELEPITGNGFIGVASHLVSTDSKYDGVVKNLLGRTLVIDNIDNAIAISKRYQNKYRLVTLEGELLSTGGSMSGGSRSSSSGIFSRASEITAISAEVGTLDEQINLLKTAIQVIKNDRNIAGELTAGLESKLRAEEQTAVRLASEKEHSVTVLDEIDAAAKALSVEKSETATKYSMLGEEYEEYNSQVAKIEWGVAEHRNIMNNLKEGASGAQGRHGELSELRISLKMQLTTVLKDIEVSRDKTHSFKQQENAYGEDIVNKTAELEKLNMNLEDLDDEIKFKEQQITGLTEFLEKTRIAAEEAIIARRNADDDVKELQQKLREKHEQAVLIQQEIGRFDTKKNKVELEIESIVGKLWEEYDLTLTQAEEIRTQIDSLPKAQRRIGEIKEEIKNLGDINIGAIEEYKSVSERFEFMSEQSRDLTLAGEQLARLIIDMQTIMMNQFKEQFDIINREFGRVFSELFGGGQASLRLTEPGNPLTSGIEIEVQPPGKTLQNMLLLSGGEKALTAISILLAILKVRPTPFCIFDEIDAALDDVNVTRFASYLRKYSTKTQFIIITHKRGTMEISNMLYGVTMQEKGVSRLLTLDMGEVAV